LVLDRGHFVSAYPAKEVDKDALEARVRFVLHLPVRIGEREGHDLRRPRAVKANVRETVLVQPNSAHLHEMLEIVKNALLVFNEHRASRNDDCAGREIFHL
jgi:hypothetical protein